MITVQLNRQSFEYDVHSLVKAFYPEQEVQITYTPEEGAKPLLKLVISFVGDGLEDPAEESQEEAAGESRAEGAKVPSADGSIRVQFIREETIALEEETTVDFAIDRKEMKNILKRLLYRMLSEYTGQF